MKQQFLRYRLLFVSVILCMAAHADVTINSTTFPDDAFRSWVLNNVSGTFDGVLTNNEIAIQWKGGCMTRLTFHSLNWVFHTVYRFHIHSNKNN